MRSRVIISEIDLLRKEIPKLEQKFGANNPFVEVLNRPGAGRAIMDGDCYRDVVAAVCRWRIIGMILHSSVDMKGQT